MYVTKHELEELRAKVDKIPQLEGQIRDLAAKVEKSQIDTEKKVKALMALCGILFFMLVIALRN